MIQLAGAARALNARLPGAGFGISVTDVLPLDRTAEARARVESGQAGRIVIAVADHAGQLRAARESEQTNAPEYADGS